MFKGWIPVHFEKALMNSGKKMNQRAPIFPEHLIHRHREELLLD